MIEIKNMAGDVLLKIEADTLRGANLGDANLGDANLLGANLRGADLGDANLRGANLGDANLGDADLRDANLRDANLLGANLRGANLRDANLPDGTRWEKYLSTVVPALLMAGGKPLAEVATEEVWACHSWDNCPMATAFGVTSEEECPPLLRPRVREFVQFFDAGLILRPEVG